MADKQIFELPEITSTILNSGIDISFVAQVQGYDLDFQVPTDVLLDFVKRQGTFNVLSGENNPDPAFGNNADLYFQTNGKVYQKQNNVWVLKYTFPNNSIITYPVPAGTQLTDYGKGFAYRIANTIGAKSVTVSDINGFSGAFVPYTINTSYIYVFLETDDTGKTRFFNNVNISAAAQGGVGSSPVTFKTAATYASLIADAPPFYPTLYKVSADETYSGAMTTYQYWPDGTIMLISSVKVN